MYSEWNLSYPDVVYLYLDCPVTLDLKQYTWIEGVACQGCLSAWQLVGLKSLGTSGGLKN